VHRARTEPTTFAIAIDASADELVDGAWRAKRARLGNVAFLIEGVERLPLALGGIADEVSVHFPWGSLLGGLLVADPVVLGPIARLLRPGALLRVLVSVTERDGYPRLEADAIRALAPAYASCGLGLIEVRTASRADIVAARSSWAKRLAVGRARPAILARYRRRDPIDD
jgi:16S rRNA (adenine(1408)-N(1))-methyltransferase